MTNGSSQSPITLTKSDIERIVEETMARTLERVGIDVKDPDEVRRARKNWAFLDDWVKFCELAKSKGVGSLISTVLLALFGLLALGFKKWVIDP